MRYSKLFGKVSKTVSKQAIVASHRFLVQGGFIRRISSGRYAFLPLGLRVRRKVENMIRQEMVKIGAQELVVPTLHPIELWQQANRDQKFGPSMMRLKDRRGAEFTLGATAEVMMVELVKQFNLSYKDLPINIFQFSQKFRDEVRASGALLRTREFIMKDGYSFHVDEDSLKQTYQLYWQAYLNIAKQLDLEVTVVESDNGAIGGMISHEFMVETDVGEDVLAKCDCGYSANLETAKFVRKQVNPDEKPKKMEIVSQPEWVMTMEDNVKHYGKSKDHFLKNVVYKDIDGTIIIGVIRGDLSVNKTKLANVYGAKGELEPATDEDLAKLGTKFGWVHCWGHKAVYVGDLSLKTVVNFIGGQKEKDTDSINVNYGRDFECDFFGDIAEAEAGAICGQCNKGKLRLVKCVEFGNIFNIGYTYSQAMDANFIDQDNHQQKFYMGSYGIGLGRAMACVIETHHDDKGIIWPKSITPYHVHLVYLNSSDPTVLGKAEQVYQDLQKADIEVLFDDRPDVSAGSKFADADLIGIPVRLLISQRSLDKGGLELKYRHSSESELIPISDLSKVILDFYKK
ncbi:proline--tRNA ligase [Candidatus Shapirobacteria bacterium]|nr:MAG: proline--tRNA ligase [Candidatus Shapirobacteria bacterium]